MGRANRAVDGKILTWFRQPTEYPSVVKSLISVMSWIKNRFEYELIVTSLDAVHMIATIESIIG